MTHERATLRDTCGRRIATWALLVALAPVRVATAEPTPAAEQEAQALFDRAFDLMDAKRYAEACPLFEESLRLAPAMGTRFRLGECLDNAGLIGSAWRLYVDVEQEATRAGREDRAAQARERIDALAPRVPWLTVSVAADIAALPGFALTCEGRTIAATDFGRRVAVDPGSNTLRATATGKAPWETTLRALEGGTLDVTVPALTPEKEVAAPTTTPPPPRPTEQSVWRSPAGKAQRIGAITVGVVGLASVGVGIGAGLVARSTWRDALRGCKDEDPTRCSPAAIADGDAAARWATVSTVGFAVGGAALVLAPILWVTAPSIEVEKQTVWLVPVIGREHGGLVAAGAF